MDFDTSGKWPSFILWCFDIWLLHSTLVLNTHIFDACYSNKRNNLNKLTVDNKCNKSTTNITELRLAIHVTKNVTLTATNVTTLDVEISVPFEFHLCCNKLSLYRWLAFVCVFLKKKFSSIIKYVFLIERKGGHNFVINYRNLT